MLYAKGDEMKIIEAVFLGIIQGLTEFLPVSSSGHLAMLQKIFGIEEPAVTFDIFLHIATLIPVFIIFWKDIVSLIKKPFQKTTLLLIAGTLPLVVIALFFKDQIDMLFVTGSFLGVNFLITGMLLILADGKKGGKKTMKEMSVPNALFIGILQGIAVMPAVSRSGATICGSLFAGLKRESAARFSFLLSIPAILGGFVMQLKGVIVDGADFFALGVTPMLAGFIAAVLSGFVAIRIMLKVIKTSRLVYFSYYVCFLGALIIIDQTIFRFYF